MGEIKVKPLADELREMVRAEILRSAAILRAEELAVAVDGVIEMTLRDPSGVKICAALGFDPTNHHNAAKCPYCSPSAISSEGWDTLYNTFRKMGEA